MDNNEICRIKYKLYLKESIWEFLPVKGKRPIRLDGEYLTDWPNKSFSIKECFTAKELTAIGVKTGLHLLCLDFDGQSAFEYAWSEEGISPSTNSFDSNTGICCLDSVLAYKMGGFQI